MINIYFHVVDSETGLILEKLRKLRHREIKLWFNKSDNKEAITYIKDKSFIEYRESYNGLDCYLWNVSDIEIVPLYDNDGIFHMAFRYAFYGTNFVCIDSKEYVKKQLVLFHDAVNEIEYPKELIKIPCYKDWDSLFQHLKDNGIFSFSLSDTNRFQKCSHIDPIQGATVYKEIDTGYYWYMDNFHKTHYEVFDSSGKKHLGEANLNGFIDRNKVDKDKRPIL